MKLHLVGFLVACSTAVVVIDGFVVLPHQSSSRSKFLVQQHLFPQKKNSSGLSIEDTWYKAAGAGKDAVSITSEHVRKKAHELKVRQATLVVTDDWQQQQYQAKAQHQRYTKALERAEYVLDRALDRASQKYDATISQPSTDTGRLVLRAQDLFLKEVTAAQQHFHETLQKAEAILQQPGSSSPEASSHQDVVLTDVVNTAMQGAMDKMQSVFSKQGEDAIGTTTTETLVPKQQQNNNAFNSFMAAGNVFHPFATNKKNKDADHHHSGTTRVIVKGGRNQPSLLSSPPPSASADEKSVVHDAADQLLSNVFGGRRKKSREDIVSKTRSISAANNSKEDSKNPLVFQKSDDDDMSLLLDSIKQQVLDVTREGVSLEKTKTAVKELVESEQAKELKKKAVDELEKTKTSVQKLVESKQAKELKKKAVGVAKDVSYVARAVTMVASEKGVSIVAADIVVAATVAIVPLL